MRYSPVTQITPDNVKDLKVAWTYRIGEPSLRAGAPDAAAEVPRMLAKGLTPEVHRMPALEATPILAEGRLYLCSSSNRVVALDPENGHELWSFDPKLDTTGAVLLLCRGVSYYRDANCAAGRRLRESHLHRHAGCTPHRPRCARWQAVRRLRRRRHGGPEGRARQDAAG